MSLILDRVTITHRQQKEPLFDPVSLEISSGQTATIMGPSGCGKSTLLAAVTGSLSDVFELSGTIALNGDILNGLPIEKRKVGILFQDDLLFPHLDVYGNLAFGLPGGQSKSEKLGTIEKALASADLAGFTHRDVATLSGGQKARISLLRTLLSQPNALLLDEPFSKLDQQLRQSFREFVFQHIHEQQVPALLVTHDPEDCPGGIRVHLDSGRMETC